MADNYGAPKQELARDLGFLEAYTMGVGTMIGAGIFILPGIVAANAGPAGMISFVIGGLVSLLTALSLSELATGMPKAGGSYYYTNTALGSFFGSIVGWSMWTGLMFATAFYMLGFGQYLTYFYGNLPVAGAALAMAALLIWVNVRGVQEAGSLQNLIVILLIGFILVFLAFGVFNLDAQTFRPFNPEGWGAVASTAATVYVSFIGFEVIATSAEEIKNPGRNLPLSMIASVLTPTLFYVLVMLVATGVLPIDELATSNIPVADVAQEYLGTFGALMMVLGAVLATVSSANASILSAARVNFAMGRDKILPSWLKDVHDRFRTPYRAILVTGGVILTLIAIGVGLETLADVASFAYLITYALVHASVIVMRRADPATYDPDFRLPSYAYPAVPLLGLASSIVIVAQMRWIVLLIGGGIVVLGAVWYFAYAQSRAVKPSMVGEAIAARDQEPAPMPSGRYRVVTSVSDPDQSDFLQRAGAAIASGHAEYANRDVELIAVSVIEVPQQMSLKHGLEVEEERVQRQQNLLVRARETADDLGIGLRTRSIVGRTASDAILGVADEEQASHIVLGWHPPDTQDHILGSTIDPIVQNANCELTIVKEGIELSGRTVALVGNGPYARYAVQRAAEIVRWKPDAELTLLNIQSSDGDRTHDPQEQGLARIGSVAKEAGISLEYNAEVIVTDENLRETLIDAVSDYDTICIGASRDNTLTRAIRKSIPDEIARTARGTVVVTRGPYHEPRSITQGIIDWLSGWTNGRT